MKKNKEEKFNLITRVLYIIVIVINIVLAVLIYFKIINKVKCPKGYDSDGDYCVTTFKEDTKEELYCEMGYELKNGKCQKYEVLDATMDYSCAKINGDSELRVSSPQLVGTRCLYVYEHDPVEKAECEFSNVCYLETQDTCNCRFELPADVQGVGEHQRIWCTQGYLQNGKCIYYTTVESKKKKLCVDGFTLVNNVCKMNKYVDAYVSPTCPDGYSLNSRYCEKTVVEDAKIKYSCSEGYTLKGNQCTKKEYIKRK